MSKALQQVLGGRNVTRIIQEVAGGVSIEGLPPALFAPTMTIERDRGTYQKTSTTRKAARRAPYGSKSRSADQAGITETPFVAIHTVESVDHELATLMNLMNEGPGNSMQRLGEQTVARKTADFAMRFQNLRRSAVMSAFSNGAVYFDNEGNIQTSSSTIDLDYQIPSGNKTQFNTIAAGGGSTILSANWDTAATDIIGQLKLLKKTAKKRTGLALRHCIYGENVLGYLLGNTAIKELINRSEQRRNAAAAGEIPDGLLGLSWWSADDAFTDIGGTLTDWFGADDVVFFPEVSTQWYDLAEGTYPVPRSIEVSPNDPAALLANVDIQAGMFSYSHGQIDPPSIKQVMGDTFMPLITNPNAVFTGSVPTS